MRLTSLLLPCWLILALAVSVTPCQAQDLPVEQDDPKAVATTPKTVNVENVADDSKIETRLQKILESTGWFEEVEVASVDGFVTIDGIADSAENSAWASEIAMRTTDVIGVNNQLAIESAVDVGESLGVVWQSLDRLYRDFLLRLPFIVAGFLVVVLTALLSRLARWVFGKVLEKRSFRDSLKDLIQQLASITIWISGLLLATVVVFPGMTPSKALTVLGLGSVAIGFAFKDIFENFFAGVLILWRYPVEKGDFIEHGDVMGKIEEITIRNTMIRRPDGELVVIPNAQLFKNSVEVLTNRPKRRVRITCGVGYGEDIAEAREVIREAVADCQTISGPKAVEVFANEFGSSSIDFEVAWWTDAKPQDVRRSRDEVITAIKAALNRAEIEIPFPYRTLTFSDELKADSRHLIATAKSNSGSGHVGPGNGTASS